MTATAQGTPGHVLELLIRSARRSTFSVVRTGTVSQQGTVQWAGLTPFTNSTFTVREKGGSPTSATLAETVHSAISLSARRSGATTLVFSGTASPLRPGQTVYLYQRTNRGLVTLGSSRVDSHGRWTIRHRFASPQRRMFVAGTKADMINATGRSAARTYATH